MPLVQRRPLSQSSGHGLFLALRKASSLPAENSPETPRSTRDPQGELRMSDLLLFLTTENAFVLALQCNYRSYRETGLAGAATVRFNNQPAKPAQLHLLESCLTPQLLLHFF